MNGKHETRIEFSGALVVVVVLAIIFAVSFALWAGVWGAIAVTTVSAVILVAALVIWSNRKRHPSATDAPHVEPAHDGRYRILVVADGTCTTSALADAIGSRASGRSALVFVMAPALETRLGFLADDEKGYQQGAARLTETLGLLEQAGLSAEGVVGPPDPLQAADDGLRQFPADEIVFVTSPAGGGNWLEDGVVGMAESRFDQPVSHVAAASGTD